MVKIFPLGESALTIEFSNEISPETNDQVIALANYFETDKFAGFVETVPAYASLTIIYDVWTVRTKFRQFPTAFEAVKSFVENALTKLPKIEKGDARAIEIPVRFDEKSAPDLKFVGETNNLSPDDVIEIFTNRIYRVYMLGFLPGFAYMGEIDARIAAPRKIAPRAKVPAGSVAIAGRQTGIYPFASPGGWQIIGRTDVEMFTSNRENPTFLRAGDSVKFSKTND
jgi:inhibitor of KinA